MEFPSYTVKDLADFAMTVEEELEPASAATAITQATLLMRIGTCLKEAPTDPPLSDIWKNGTLDMALKLYYAAQHTAQKYSPYSSETIGSYSYTVALGKLKSGEETGAMWFDIAVMELGVCDLMGNTGANSSGGISVFEYDGTFTTTDTAGNVRLLSPNDIGEYPPFPVWR